MTASGGVAYRWGDGTTVERDVLYGSGLRRGFANTEHLPSYSAVQRGRRAHVRARRGSARSTSGSPCINVFDRVYELRDGSGIGVGAPQFGLRRAFYVTAGKTF